MNVIWSILIILAIHTKRTTAEADAEIIEDWLIPYAIKHGSRLSHRSIRECQTAQFNNVTHELYKAHSSSDLSLPIYERSMFSQNVGSVAEHYVMGNIIKVNNPFKTFTVVEPGGPGGCANHTRSRVSDSMRVRGCLVGANAGFFNTPNGACLGNLVVDGVQIQNTGGIQNAQFGIKRDGALFTGYLPETVDLSDDFHMLVGGVLWLVRDGVNYVDEAVKAECGDTQETGTLQSFADVVSARTALGHDADGRVVMVQIDGKTWSRGINLYDFADLLISMGVVNAINTDGGGSATLVVEGVVASHPSDERVRDGVHYTQERAVSTAACVVAPPCPHDCHGDRGHCLQNGLCRCHGYWTGIDCGTIQCGALNCSGQGLCTEHGCVCRPGYLGPECTNLCPTGRYGASCAHSCRCANGATCSHVDGSCECPSGYTGLLCDRECPYGFYGQDCRQICYCEDSCFCDHVTGLCNVSAQETSFYTVSNCLAERHISKRHLVPDYRDQYNLWLTSTISLAAVAALSIILNIAIVCLCVTRLTSPAASNDHQVALQGSSKRAAGSQSRAKRRKTYRAQATFERSLVISSYSSDEVSAVENKPNAHVLGSDKDAASQGSGLFGISAVSADTRGAGTSRQGSEYMRLMDEDWK